MPEFMMDWKLWLFILNLIMLAFHFFSHQKIVYNDLKHLAIDTKEIKDKQKEHSTNISHINNEISYIKGAKENEDKVIKLLENTLKNKS